MMADIVSFCKACRKCQLGSSIAPKKAPLCPIPIVEEPFSRVVIDVVGSLPRTKSGNVYLLTLMCSGTRYPDAIPVSSSKSRKLIPRLMDVFSKFGVPKEVQSDRGSNFMGELFKQTFHKLGVKHITSSAYHPQSQGCLERFHKTLKSTLTKFCLENNKDWDEGIQVALYAIRCASQESLGYSPFELMFGRKARENLRVLFESWEGEAEPEKLAKYIIRFRDRMACVQRLAKKNMETAQGKMKKYFDRKAVERHFQPGVNNV